MFEGLGLEQHWRPPWLSLELVMAPKNKASKLLADRAEASKAAAFAAAGTVMQDSAATAEPPAPQAVGDNTVPPLGREETPEEVV